VCSAPGIGAIPGLGLGLGLGLGVGVGQAVSSLSLAAGSTGDKRVRTESAASYASRLDYKSRRWESAQLQAGTLLGQ
jgi:hypothetical protein